MTDEEFRKMCEFVNSSPSDIAKIVFSYLDIEDKTAIVDGLNKLSKTAELTPQEASAFVALGPEVVANAQQMVRDFQTEYGLDAAHGVNLVPPLPPLILNDAWNLGAELKAMVESKQDADNPPDIGDGVNHTGEDQNGAENNAGEFNGRDDDHKEGEVIDKGRGR